MKEPVAKCSFQAQTENQFIKNLLIIAVQENFSNFFLLRLLKTPNSSHLGKLNFWLWAFSSLASLFFHSLLICNDFAKSVLTDFFMLNCAKCNLFLNLVVFIRF